MSCLGFDFGTYNLVVAEPNGDGWEYRHQMNAFIQMPLGDRAVFNMMKMAKVPLVEKHGDNTAYALGKSAVSMAHTMTGVQLRRPMKDGCVNPGEVDAQQILNLLAHNLIGKIKQDNTVIYYSVPANAINTETDADYHGKVLESILKAYRSEDGYKLDPRPLNEGLALVYSELGDKAFTGCGVSCLVPGTKIYTRRGVVPIEDVVIGDEVITHKGRWRKVNNVIVKEFNGVSTKLQIQGYSDTTDDYQFVDDHELYVMRDGVWRWVGCESIVEGDIVGEPVIGENRHNKKPNAMCLYEKATNAPPVKKSYVMSGPIQRLIGYFLGDGSVNKAEGCIQFDFANHETDNITDVQNILKETFGKNSSTTPHGPGCTRVKCYSRALMTWFDKKCYSEDREKQYPFDIADLNKNECINLLAGMVRSDGTSNEGCVSFGNTSTSLIVVAKQLFSRLGIAASIDYRNARSHELSCGRVINGKKTEWRVASSATCGISGLFEIIENIHNSDRFPERTYIDNGFCCGKVQKIENEEYEGLVYDLQVEEDHSFSGPYLTIHNCGAGMVNVCVAVFGAPVLTFAIVNSGDWIDKQASKAIGEETTNYVNREKMKADLTVDSPELVQRAIKAQYEIMIQKTVSEIKRGLEGTGNKIRSDEPMDFVVAGGTSMPKGFPELFERNLKDAGLGITIGRVFRPEEPLYSVAKGCCIAAQNSQ